MPDGKPIGKIKGWRVFPMKLKEAVDRHGGIFTIRRDRKWQQVRRDLNLVSCTSFGHTLNKMYIRYDRLGLFGTSKDRCAGTRHREKMNSGSGAKEIVKESDKARNYKNFDEKESNNMVMTANVKSPKKSKKSKRSKKSRKEGKSMKSRKEADIIKSWMEEGNSNVMMTMWSEMENQGWKSISTIALQNLSAEFLSKYGRPISTERLASMLSMAKRTRTFALEDPTPESRNDNAMGGTTNDEIYDVMNDKMQDQSNDKIQDDQANDEIQKQANDKIRSEANDETIEDLYGNKEVTLQLEFDRLWGIVCTDAIKRDGALVTRVLKDGAAGGIIEVGDVILQVNGTKIKKAKNLVESIDNAMRGIFKVRLQRDSLNKPVLDEPLSGTGKGQDSEKQTGEVASASMRGIEGPDSENPRGPSPGKEEELALASEINHTMAELGWSTEKFAEMVNTCGGIYLSESEVNNILDSDMVTDQALVDKGWESLAAVAKLQRDTGDEKGDGRGDGGDKSAGENNGVGVGVNGGRINDEGMKEDGGKRIKKGLDALLALDDHDASKAKQVVDASEKGREEEVVCQ